MIASMLLALFLTPYAYTQANENRNRRLPDEMRRKYAWIVIPITVAVTLFVGLVVSGAFEMLTRAFEGVQLSRLAASLRIATFIGIFSYVLVSWIMRMRNSNLIYIAVFYLFATLLTAGATHENAMWYQNSFSYLGMTESNSKFIFNVGLPFTGLLIVIWSLFFTEYLDVLLETEIITSRTRGIIRWGVILTGILLSLVGIVRFGIGLFFNIIHDLSATGMGVVLGVLMLLMPWLIN